MDRIVSLVLYGLALALGCAAALLVLGGFVEYLVHERWPDQSLLRLGYDSGLIRARWFLTNDWGMSVRDVLSRVPAALAAAVLAPLCWWLGGRIARR